ncbi:MAG: hypothetical protein CL663_03510 [Bacteroidetes bacterium]|nr:hypothetical protein [Bacteroidota bacterium]
MKKLILTAVFFVFTLFVYSGVAKVLIMHKGKVKSISSKALKAPLKHGDELMVLHEGQWITASEYESILTALEKDYEEVGAESADVDGEEDVEEY